MLIFEKLRPFVWMCQFFGLFPFVMEIDPQTKLFKKFFFSWKKPVTWWFVFILIGQFLLLCININLAWKLNSEESVMQNVPFLLAAIFFFEYISFFILISATRYMM